MASTRVRVLALSCVSLCFALSLFARQQTSITKDSKNSDTSTEAFIVESLSTKIVFENDGTSTQETTARLHIQSQAGLTDWGVLNFPYASGTSTLQVVYVRVVKPDRHIVQTPPENLLEMPAEITRQAPFYSDLKDEQVAVKGLEVGDRLEYQYREVVTKPLDPGQFWLSFNFFEGGIILNEELEVSVPRERPILLKSANVQPLVSDEGPRRVYTWRTNHLHNKPAQDSSQDTDQDEKPSSVRISTFRTWDDLGEWFRSLVAPRVVVTPEIQAKADELSHGAKTDAEKTQAIYNFVSTKFRYIGIALGIGRYQPHAAADVLTNDYGDCKDKHTLFAALLAAEHIRAFPALINSSRKIDPDFPSPEQFDHIITAIPRDKGFLFLDTTAEVAPFGFLIAELRDKKALVIPDSGPVQLADTPKDPPFKSFFDFQADGALDNNGTFDAKMQMSVRGDEEITYRLAFRQASQSQWKVVMQNVSSTLGYGGTVGDVIAVSSPDETDEPFHLSYTYSRKEYGDWQNHRIFSPFPAILLPAVPDDAGKKPIKLGSPNDFLMKGSMKLPANSHPILPVPVTLHEEFGDYQSSCSVSDGVMHFERHLRFTKSEVTPGQVEVYRKFQKAVLADINTFIPLSASSAVGKPSENQDAQSAFEQGGDAWQQNNLLAAREDFQRAIKKDPNFGQAWLALGMADFALGAENDGAEEVRKAVQLDPAAVVGYKFVASLFMTQHREDDALKWWRELEKAAPDDEQAPKNIAEILMHHKHYTDAVPELEAAVKNDVDSVSLQVQLADAYLHTGKANQADSIFAKVVAGTPDADTLNTVAYELADNRMRLDDALQYAQKAVTKIENDTAAISLDNLLQQDLRTTPNLAAYWDTLGWVHFKMGHLDLAEKYVNAAWSITQSAVMADHLGQIYQREGKIHDAAVAYARALSTSGEVPEDTRGRLRSLRPEGTLQRGESPDADALQDLRSTTLRKLANGHATAEFFLLFKGDSKSVDVKFVSGSDALQDAVKVLAATNFSVLFPDGTSARILRRGLLDCEPEADKCMFVFIPPGSVTSLH